MAGGIAAGMPVPRTLQVGFVNNTPFRAIFSAGTYDELNSETLPTGFLQIRLEGNTASAQAVLACRKSVSVGGAELIRLLTLNQNDPNIPIGDQEALVDGVNFSSAPLGDPLEAAPTEGKAEGLVLSAGVDFNCARTDIRQTAGTGLIVFTFEQDPAAPGGFRVDFMFIPA